MAKGFSVPGFSIPKISVPKSIKVPTIKAEKLPNMSGLTDMASQIDIPEVGNLKDSLSGMGIKSVSDAKNMFLGGGESKGITIPTVAELKEAATSKVDTAKNVVKAAKEGGIKEGLKAAIPQEYKDMKQTMEESGVSFDFGSLKEKFKGGD